jgi:hypothetical protein
MKMLRHMVAVTALGTVMTCYYYPHDRGYHQDRDRRDRDRHRD